MPIMTTSGDRSSPPIGGNMRRIGARTGSVKRYRKCATDAIGDDGLNGKNDKMARAKIANENKLSSETISDMLRLSSEADRN